MQQDSDVSGIGRGPRQNIQQPLTHPKTPLGCSADRKCSAAVCAEIKSDVAEPAQWVEAFDTMWRQNKELLCMKKDVNFPINYRRGMDWAAHHCDAASAKFAEEIVANTVYISFREFMAALDKICASFKHYYAKQPGRDKITFVLVVPFGMSKSNIWVSLLMWPAIRELVHDIDFDITSVYNKYKGRNAAAEYAGRRIICIICDDCAYTGNQLLNYCKFNPHLLDYTGKPEEPAATSHEWIEWDRTVTAKTARIEADTTVDTFAVNLLIPYISTHAQQNIIDRPFMMLPKDVQIFKLFRERINVTNYNQGVLREFESSFQYHSNIAAIYFDHKIADAISTFNKVYLLAPVFGCGDLRKSLCFIDGCNNREIPPEIDVYGAYVNIEGRVGSGNVCPSTYYKGIKYSMDGRSVADLCVRDALMIHIGKKKKGGRP